MGFTNCNTWHCTIGMCRCLMVHLVAPGYCPHLNCPIRTLYVSDFPDALFSHHWYLWIMCLRDLWEFKWFLKTPKIFLGDCTGCAISSVWNKLFTQPSNNPFFCYPGKNLYPNEYVAIKLVSIEPLLGLGGILILILSFSHHGIYGITGLVHKGAPKTPSLLGISYQNANQISTSNSQFPQAAT